ncbi:MAG: hypothetical protein J6C82_02840 [Clostridia bacterium]|nr:hypothetical protein [Clostridia bacterium]
MARKGRVLSDIGIYHILLRGVNVLFESDADFNEFTAILQRYSEDKSVQIFSYTLLKNRIHLVIYSDSDIGKALKPICTSYARYFNRTYGGSGKLFYDRFKSEPINSNDELRSAVGFVNAISAKSASDYPYCSLSDAGRKICTGSGRLTAAELTAAQVTEMYIEDYDCLSPKEISEYITDICGIAPKDFKTLEKQQLDAALERLTKKRWISRTKLYDILGIKKIQTKPSAPKTTPKPAPKTEPQPRQQKQELSVWLL